MVDKVDQINSLDQSDDRTDDEIELEDIEIELLLEAVYLRYGYDFRSYSKASIRRRIVHRLNLSEFETISEMISSILHDKQFFVKLLADLTINVTEMFRDPEFYRTFREEVVPLLKTFPFIKIWHAGCATGEEIYSMAILLSEEGLYERSMIYATDIDRSVLAKAKKGIFSEAHVNRYAENYEKSGGKAKLSDYYTAKYDGVMMNQDLKRNIVFADHDLATDEVFGEMHVIMCRNVIIYFNKDLQRRVFRLFRDSLDLGGVLCLGTKETLRFSDAEEEFEVLVKGQKIYRKKTEAHYP